MASLSLSAKSSKSTAYTSDELPVFPRADGSVNRERESGEDYRLNCDAGFGSAAYLTGAMGFTLAAEVVKRIAMDSY